ncbi:MAG: hypothetical protein AB3N34_00435 [Lettuce witches'-broom phytoplasma]
MFSLTPIHAHSYFHKQIKTTIKLISNQTLQQQWLSKQPKLRRHDINVSNKDYIPGMLKYYDITDASAYSPPSYNAANSGTMHWYFKNPPQGLLGVYFKARPNPFKSSYPATDHQ